MNDAPLFAEVADGPADGRAVWLDAGGVRIRAAIWNANAANGTVFVLPGRTEYVEKYGRAATELGHHGFATLSIDWRGQGMADRALLDKMSGHVGNFDEYQTDLDTLIAFAKSQGLPRPFYLIAHSMGGCIGLRALLRGSDFNAVAFSAPMWGILITAWMKPIASILSTASRMFSFDHRYAPGTNASTYVIAAPFVGNTLTTDPEMWDYMRQQAVAHPDLSLGGPTYAWVRAALIECHALTLLKSPATPAICALGTREGVVDSRPIHARMAKWSNGRLDLYPGSEHEVMMERPETRNTFLRRAAELFGANR
ncbi:MAG: alpha/beta fold hydrolase [Paracoccaceae bacterium]